MKIFGQIVRTVVNVGVLPVAIAKDTVNAISIAGGYGESDIAKQLQKIKREAGED